MSCSKLFESVHPCTFFEAGSGPVLHLVLLGCSKTDPSCLSCIVTTLFRDTASFASAKARVICIRSVITVPHAAGRLAESLVLPVGVESSSSAFFINESCCRYFFSSCQRGIRLTPPAHNFNVWQLCWPRVLLHNRNTEQGPSRAVWEDNDGYHDHRR